ncbi:MAG TPA: hypothetical protein ENI63_01810 [Candidatus Kaiserbacteria bacterium]|nr:hypothetical protein [Candidatus Kaiserbacteria bacterium]
MADDKNVQELIPETYGEARIDAQKFRSSELGILWKNTSEEIAQKEEVYTRLEQQLHLHEISGQGRISSSKSRMARLAKNLTDVEERKNNLETLRGFPKTAEYTDAAANFQYKKLEEYRKQLDKGFVWLPSRKKIHRETISAILNHRWPVLIGETGAGKSDQANAAAIELTGNLPTEIECESTTGETQLIKEMAIGSETEGSYEKYGPLMQAFTGYDNSIQERPTFKTGRIARFDESGRLGPKAYSIIKKVRQKKEGDDFYGRPVLPGASAIWTSNPVGQRYPGRYAPDPAMRRELAEIYVDYPEMTNEEPELYEFALAALFDKNNHLDITKEEIGPRYEKKEIPEDKREVLKDGGVIIAEDEIIKNINDSRHGALWRFCGAIKSLQESFIYGNAATEKYPDTILRFKEDSDGNIEIIPNGEGEPLTLSTSTVTLGELASWMSGFNERAQKRNEEFRVDTLTEWLDFKINTYLKQADSADKEKIRALFKYFHFLEDLSPETSESKPFTPKEIGYLSPRVPRPVYVEYPKSSKDTKTDEEGLQQSIKEAKKYETYEVTLDEKDNPVIKIKLCKFGFGDEKNAGNVDIGDKFIVGGESFTFAGIVEDESSQRSGQPVGQLASGEKLYKVFSSEELDWGIREEYVSSFKNDLEDMGKQVDDFCEVCSSLKQKSKP